MPPGIGLRSRNFNKKEFGVSIYRAVITSTIDSSTWRNEGENLNDWLQAGIAENWWGYPEMWKSQFDCTPEEIASALESRMNELSQVIEYRIPAQYFVETF